MFNQYVRLAHMVEEPSTVSALTALSVVVCHVEVGQLRLLASVNPLKTESLRLYLALRLCEVFYCTSH